MEDMIDVNDLRIGNLVLAGNMWEVRGGHGPYKQTIREVCLISRDIDDEYDEYVETVEPGKSNNAIDDLCCNINPIPLTEEWLKDLGFVAGNLPVFEGYVKIRFMFNSPPLVLDIDNHRMPLHHVKYVHQLQNLYYALTSEELKINLENK